MPEADISVVRGRSGDGAEQPEAPTFRSSSTLRRKSLIFDRTQKLTTYAGGGIPVYWIVNLVDRQVEVHSGPGREAYRSREVYAPGQDVPIVIDGKLLGQVAVIDLLP